MEHSRSDPHALRQRMKAALFGQSQGRWVEVTQIEDSKPVAYRERKITLHVPCEEMETHGEAERMRAAEMAKIMQHEVPMLAHLLGQWATIAPEDFSITPTLTYKPHEPLKVDLAVRVKESAYRDKIAKPQEREGGFAKPRIVREELKYVPRPRCTVPPRLLETLFDDFSKWSDVEINGVAMRERVLHRRSCTPDYETVRANVATALTLARVPVGKDTIARGEKIYCESHRGDIVVRVPSELFRSAAPAMTAVLRAQRAAGTEQGACR